MQGRMARKVESPLSLTTEALQETFSVIKDVDFVSMIIRLLKIIEAKDPRENVAHTSRVSFYSLAIFDRYCQNNRMQEMERIRFKAALRVAAMLHDIGKIEIPDIILNKTGHLTENEVEVMKTHTWAGARLFFPISSFIDQIIYEVTLRHHENWDGTGYPGYVDVLTGKTLKVNPKTGMALGLKGTEIPLSARIVSIADVYDVLSSRRMHKDAWKEDAVLNEINRSKGIKFQPELVDIFFDVLPEIRKIKLLYKDR